MLMMWNDVIVRSHCYILYVLYTQRLSYFVSLVFFRYPKKSQDVNNVSSLTWLANVLSL